MTVVYKILVQTGSHVTDSAANRATTDSDVELIRDSGMLRVSVTNETDS